MKNRQTIYAILAALIVVVAGALGYSQLVPHKAASVSSTSTVEVVTPIQAGLNQAALDQLTNIAITQDFSIQLNPAIGVGNATPFGG